MKTLIALVVILALGAGAWFYFRGKNKEEPQYQTTMVARGNLTQVVTATGQLNAVLNVQVGSQVSGNIMKLHADFNSEVKEGQLVAELDPATYRASVQQAEGELDSAKAAVELARLTEERKRELVQRKSAPQADLDAAVAAKAQAEATVRIKEASLARAKVDLGRCSVYSPINGIVISRDVDVGQTVAASLNAPVLFKIANDLRNMQIDANVAEADVGNVRVGQDVEFTVDAYPYITFWGKVEQVRNAPVTVENVVSYDTVISVKNEDLKLKPGMTANVAILIAGRNNVLTVSNAALRYRPAGKKGASTETARRGSSRQGSGGGGKKAHSTEGQGKTLFVMRPGKTEPESVKVKLGISDGITTEVLEGLAEGDAVVTASLAKQADNNAQPTSPFGGGIRRF